MVDNGVLDAWRATAERQGWSIKETKQGHWLWRSPTGETVTTASSRKAPTGRGLLNARSQLRRAGLALDRDGCNPLRVGVPVIASNGALVGYKIEEEEPVAEFKVVDADRAPKMKLVSPTIDELAEEVKEIRLQMGLAADSIEASVKMLEELSDQYTTFRKGISESITELRGDVRKLQQAKPPEAPKVDTSAFASKGEVRTLLEKLEELEERVSEAKAKADPIAAFRARLNR